MQREVGKTSLSLVPMSKLSETNLVLQDFSEVLQDLSADLSSADIDTLAQTGALLIQIEELLSVQIQHIRAKIRDTCPVGTVTPTVSVVLPPSTLALKPDADVVTLRRELGVLFEQCFQEALQVKKDATTRILSGSARQKNVFFQNVQVINQPARIVFNLPTE